MLLINSIENRNKKYILTCIHTYFHRHTHSYVHTYIHTYIHAHIQTYIHTYTDTHTFIPTYMHPYRHTYYLSKLSNRGDQEESIKISEIQLDSSVFMGQVPCGDFRK